MSKLKRTQQGIGYIGIGIYQSNTIAYSCWREIFKRCYCEKEQLKYPTYVGCTVDERWHNFQAFSEWYYKNLPNTQEKIIFNLDKDILIKGNKIYGPDTCCVIPVKLNCLFIKPTVQKELPLGVRKSTTKGKYISQITKNNKHITLGTFTTIEEAAEKYKKTKEQYIREVSEEYKHLLPKEVYDVLQTYEI